MKWGFIDSIHYQAFSILSPRRGGMVSGRGQFVLLLKALQLVTVSNCKQLTDISKMVAIIAKTIAIIAIIIAILAIILVTQVVTLLVQLVTICPQIGKKNPPRSEDDIESEQRFTA